MDVSGKKDGNDNYDKNNDKNNGKNNDHNDKNNKGNNGNNNNSDYCKKDSDCYNYCDDYGYNNNGNNNNNDAWCDNNDQCHRIEKKTFYAYDHFLTFFQKGRQANCEKKLFFRKFLKKGRAGT